MMAAAIFIFAGCSDDDEAASFDQTEFYGTWELSNSTDAEYKECPDNPLTLIVTENEMVIPFPNDQACQGGAFTAAYTFNGNVFSVAILT